jgi:acyl-CoA synthetase (AMP-forming)/AMP-acid ligase II
MIPTSNLASQLRQTARRFPDRLALAWGERQWNWADMARRVDAAAAGLLALGLSKGDRVLVHARNSHALIETMWACWTIGAVWVPTNFRLSPPEVAYLASSSRAAAHIFDAAFPSHEAAARQANAAARIHIDIGEDWEALAATPGPPPDLANMDRDDPAWFFYTSGTTGRPKAGILTHGQLAFVITNHLCDLMPGTTERDVSLVVAPLSHGAGIHQLTQVARGAASVLLPGAKLDCEVAWRLVEQYRVSNMFTVPTILTMLARHPAAGEYDHSSLRYVIYAGAPLHRVDQQQALRVLGPVLVQYFGLGEVTGNITVLPPHLHTAEDDPAYPIGSCGVPRTGMDIAILDDTGRRLAPGETGEIGVRGPAVFAGYFDNPEANAKAFKDGWFRTGDVGHLDAKGFLYITGRQSDMYISGGSNVYPREVEEALLQHPGIAEACVLGMPDAKWGESGVAVLVAHDGASIDPQAALASLDGRLARYKWPREVVVWDALPRSGYGKVVKAEIRRLLQANPA